MTRYSGGKLASCQHQGYHSSFISVYTSPPIQAHPSTSALPPLKRLPNINSRPAISPRRTRRRKHPPTATTSRIPNTNVTLSPDQRRGALSPPHRGRRNSARPPRRRGRHTTINIPFLLQERVIRVLGVLVRRHAHGHGHGNRGAVSVP